MREARHAAAADRDAARARPVQLRAYAAPDGRARKRGAGTRVSWASITSALDIAVELDLCQVRLGAAVFELTAIGPESFRAVCRASGETHCFELSHGGPLGHGVSNGTGSRAKMIGLAWVAISARAKRSPLPAAW